MAVFIKNVFQRNLIEFDKGLFDDWCVYLTRYNARRYAPKDTEYFLWLQQMSTLYGAARIYNDFVAFYTPASAKLSTEVLELITAIAASYGKDAEEMDIWLTVIYAGMVAEENKENAILKKRIKRLGLHQLLLENKDVEFAAHFSRGKPWKLLDGLMQERGF